MFSLLLLAGILATAYSEKTCDLVFENATFDSPKELQSGLQGCTTIKGHIIQLSPLFGDVLTLPGLTEVEGGITVDTFTGYGWSDVRHDFLYEEGSLKTIVFDNLTSIGNLTLGDAFALQNLQLPSLLKTDYLELHSNNTVNITLPDVRSIEKLLLRGSSSLMAPELAWINKTFSIDNQRGPDNMTVNLQSLLTTGDMTLIGNFSSIILPQLSTTGDITIDVGIPIEVSLSELRSANNIRVKGAISSFWLPGLESLNGDLEIISNVSIKCDALQTRWNQTSKGSNSKFTCYGATPTPSRARKLRLGLGIGLGLGVSLLVLCAFLVWYFVFKQKKQGKQEYEMPKHSDRQEQ